jgi:hypothetical protein
MLQGILIVSFQFSMNCIMTTLETITQVLWNRIHKTMLQGALQVLVWLVWSMSKVVWKCMSHLSELLKHYSSLLK